MSRKLAISGFVAGVVATIALLLIGGMSVVYSGLYNIAATEQHSALVRWAFHTTFHRSVETRARAVTVPKDITPAMIEAGAKEYAAMCQECHSAPGAEAAEWAKGMRPRPPELQESAAEWELREVFWLVKHGAKMTGMPAFGPTHDDATLWKIAAFVKDLPAMTSERYQGLSGQHGGEPSSGSPAGGAHSH